MCTHKHAHTCAIRARHGRAATKQHTGAKRITFGGAAQKSQSRKLKSLSIQFKSLPLQRVSMKTCAHMCGHALRPQPAAPSKCPSQCGELIAQTCVLANKTAHRRFVICCRLYEEHTQWGVAFTVTCIRVAPIKPSQVGRHRCTDNWRRTNGSGDFCTVQRDADPDHRVTATIT